MMLPKFTYRQLTTSSKVKETQVLDTTRPIYFHSGIQCKLYCTNSNGMNHPKTNLVFSISIIHMDGLM
jgi:hypothetical protein